MEDRLNLLRRRRSSAIVVFITHFFAIRNSTINSNEKPIQKNENIKYKNKNLTANGHKSFQEIIWILTSLFVDVRERACLCVSVCVSVNVLWLFRFVLSFMGIADCGPSPNQTHTQHAFNDTVRLHSLSLSLSPSLSDSSVMNRMK